MSGDDHGARDTMRLVVFLAAVLVAAAAFKMVWTSLVEAPGRAVRSLGEGTATAIEQVVGAVREVFQVEPVVEGRALAAPRPSMSVAELVLVKREIPLTYKWKHTFLGSSKTIDLRAVYVAAAGFDLDEQFLVRAEGNAVVVVLPRARLLSVERTGEVGYQDQDGWWNRVRDDERGVVLTEFDRRARAHAAGCGVVGEAEAEAGRRLRELLAPHGVEVKVEFAAPPAEGIRPPATNPAP